MNAAFGERLRAAIWTVAFLALGYGPLATADTFVNWENPQVHPIELTPDATKLLVVNTADARLEVFDVALGVPVPVGAVLVGLDPVSVRALTNRYAWVVNHISDSVSIVDLETLSVVSTIQTADEPADVVFAGDPLRAYVSCSQANQVQVFEPSPPYPQTATIEIDGEDPRAMAVSNDRRHVYVAIFESGNKSTLVPGASPGRPAAPDVVSDPSGPYGGRNPPPNDGDAFNPPINPDLPPPPHVALIVKQDATGRWMDDNHGDWTDVVSGPRAELSRRPVGWHLPDHDVAVIDTKSGTVDYTTGLMNLCMAVAVNPATSQVSVVGTDAINEIRFGPVLQGRFLRVNLALFDPSQTDTTRIIDLNPHLTYTVATVPQTERDKSIGDPRAVIWESSGSRGYVAGMGSNNVVIIDSSGRRSGRADAIPVGEGPTGLALDEAKHRLYVLNRFGAGISVIDTLTEREINRTPLFDPTPQSIKVGRKHLYDTHRTSGLGQTACGSCHVDARGDRLAWDLGDPSGEMKVFDQNCHDLGTQDECNDWHPMKGPMVTQTLQDIIGKEPFHWRGDREGLEEFNGAFQSLLGDDESLSPEEMQEFKEFLRTIVFPPNPFRNFDNTLPTDLPLSGHLSLGRFAPMGETLPNGNAVSGLDLFRSGKLENQFDCVTCHTLPTGTASNLYRDGLRFKPVPPGPNGELHLAIRATPRGTLKIPQLRNLYDKTGMDISQTASRAGFGLTHDGMGAGITGFIEDPAFGITSIQQEADLVAFLLAFSGSDLPTGSTINPLELLGPPSGDTHAAVGKQITLNRTNRDDRSVIAALGDMMSLADAGRVGLVAKGVSSGLRRGYEYKGFHIYQSDRAEERLSARALRNSADEGAELTFTVVPFGTQTRLGVDRDEDTFLDADERNLCSDPADAASTPENVVITGDANRNGFVDLVDFAALAACSADPFGKNTGACRCGFDFDRDSDVDLRDIAEFQLRFSPRF